MGLLPVLYVLYYVPWVYAAYLADHDPASPWIGGIVVAICASHFIVGALTDRKTPMEVKMRQRYSRDAAVIADTSLGAALLYAVVGIVGTNFVCIAIALGFSGMGNLLCLYDQCRAISD
jgi:hypothetical protein